MTDDQREAPSLINMEEMLHVYESHTANRVRSIEGEEDAYSRNELLEIIKEARDDMHSFFYNWLLPYCYQSTHTRTDD